MNSEVLTFAWESALDALGSSLDVACQTFYAIRFYWIWFRPYFFLSQRAHARNHNGRKWLKPSTSLDQGLHGKEFSNSNLHDRMERKLSWPCHDQSNAQFLVALKFIESSIDIRQYLRIRFMIGLFIFFMTRSFSFQINVVVFFPKLHPNPTLLIFHFVYERCLT